MVTRTDVPGICSHSCSDAESCYFASAAAASWRDLRHEKENPATMSYSIGKRADVRPSFGGAFEKPIT